MLLAWAAPWLLGTGGWMLGCGRPRGHAAWCAALGGGWLLGMLLLGWLLLALQGLITPQGSVLQLGPWLLVAGVLLAAMAWRRTGTTPTVQTRQSVHRLWWLLATLLLALLAWRGWLQFDEARLRPLFPWDAWLVWSIKPKTWFLLDQWVPFVEFSQWLGSVAVNTYTDAVPAYPELIGRLQVWFASGAGCWCDPAFTVLWPALWLAMLVGGYGMLRCLGVGFGPTVLAIYALGSLPLLDSHVALAGYSDLWLAVMFGFALLCWLHWQRSRRVGALVIALVFGLSLPALKVEGAVWMLLWLAIVLLGLLPRRWRRGGWLAGLALIGLLGLGLLFGGLGVPVPGLGWVQVDANQLKVTDLSTLTLGWHSVTGAVLQSLFTVPNWHLLFYLAPLLIAWRWRVLRHQTGLGLFALCLLGGVAFLFVLFFLTGAGAWASDYSSINRLVMQMVPALVFLLALLFVEPSAPEETR